jgi:hypothetical protein
LLENIVIANPCIRSTAKPLCSLGYSGLEAPRIACTKTYDHNNIEQEEVIVLKITSHGWNGEYRGA